MTLKLVRATLRDVPDYLRIERSVSSPLTLTSTTRKEAVSEIRSTTTYMIRRRNRVVGLISYRARRNNPARITELAVLPKCQGKGIGRSALQTVISELEEMGCTRIRLETHPDNPAQHLYMHLGFKVTGSIKNYMRSKTPRLVMTRHLRLKRGIINPFVLSGMKKRHNWE